MNTTSTTNICFICKDSITFLEHFEFTCATCNQVTLYCCWCRPAIAVLLNDKLFKCQFCNCLVYIASLYQSTPNFNQANQTNNNLNNFSNLNLGGLNDYELNNICNTKGNVMYDPLLMKYVNKIDKLNQLKSNINNYFVSNRVNKNSVVNTENNNNNINNNNNNSNFFDTNIYDNESSNINWATLVTNNLTNPNQTTNKLVYPYVVNNNIYKPKQNENYNMNHSQIKKDYQNENSNVLSSPHKMRLGLNSNQVQSDQNPNDICSLNINSNLFGNNNNPNSSKSKGSNNNIVTKFTNEFNQNTPEKFDEKGGKKSEDKDNELIVDINNNLENLSSISYIGSKRTVQFQDDLPHFKDNLGNEYVSKTLNVNQTPKLQNLMMNRTQDDVLNRFSNNKTINQLDANNNQQHNYSLLSNRRLPIENLLRSKGRNTGNNNQESMNSINVNSSFTNRESSLGSKLKILIKN